VREVEKSLLILYMLD